MNFNIQEKRVPQISMVDWHIASDKLREAARSKRFDSFNLRNLSYQLRNETEVLTKWDTYKNDQRLRDRIFDVQSWLNEMQTTLENVDQEIFHLNQEKISNERCMENLHVPFSVTRECLSNRDTRRIPELTNDYLSVELKKELFVAEANKKNLLIVSHDAWDILQKLNSIKRRLETEISNKYNTVIVDETQMNLNKNCSGISYKVEPFRTMNGVLTEEGWLEITKDTIHIAKNLMRESKILREALFKAQKKTEYEMNDQKNVVEHTLRKRIFETQKSRNELQWQELKMKESLVKAAKEISNLTDALNAKVNSIKLVETRAENRNFRPKLELVCDKVSEGLLGESKDLYQTVTSLQNAIDKLKHHFTNMEKTLSVIQKDLANKEDTLETDSRCLEIRAPLDYPKTNSYARTIGQTDLSRELAIDE